MFRRLDKPAGVPVEVIVDGNPRRMIEGDNLAAQLLMLDDAPFRRSEVSGDARAAHCMIGNCFDCLVEIDGKRNQQACMRQVRAGMVVNRGQGDATS